MREHTGRGGGEVFIALHCPGMADDEALPVVPPTTHPQTRLASRNDLLLAVQAFRARAPHFFPDTNLSPDQWLAPPTPMQNPSHSAAAAVRMLWSWVRADTDWHTPLPRMRDWLDALQGFRRGEQLPDQHAIDRLFNDRLAVTRVVAPEAVRSVTQPGLFFAELRDGQLQQLAAGRVNVILKWQPFIETQAEYAALVAGAAEEEQYKTGDVVRFDRLLSFSMDVLHGLRFRNLLLEDAVVLTPHFAIVLDAFALPRVTLDTSAAPHRVVLATVPPEPGAAAADPMEEDEVIISADGMVDSGRPAAPSTVCLYQLTERGDQTLYAYAHGAACTDKGFCTALWQTFFSIYVAAMRDGFQHRDLHASNVMIRSVVGTPYAGRDWLYVLPALPGTPAPSAPRLFVLPAAVHQGLFVEIIDFGHSRLLRGSDVRPRQLDSGVRFDFQKVMYGRHLTSLETWSDPIGLDPELFQVDESSYARSNLSLEMRDHLVAVCRALCAASNTLDHWPTWMNMWGAAGIAGTQVVHTFDTLVGAATAFPGLMLVGALETLPAPAQPKRRGEAAPVDPRASKRPRLESCQHCAGPSTFLTYCGPLCQALAAGVLEHAPRLGHLNTTTTTTEHSFQQ